MYLQTCETLSECLAGVRLKTLAVRNEIVSVLAVVSLDVSELSVDKIRVQLNALRTLPLRSRRDAQSHRLEVLSHNLANINTPGFKPHMSMIQSRPAEAIERGEAASGEGTIDDLGGGVTIQPNMTQFSQGAIQKTGGDTDFAINDKESFFAVQRGDKQLLTRAGNFLFDARGGLVTPNGDAVLASSGEQLQINPNIPHQVMDDGTVYQAGQRRMLMLVQPKATGDLTRVGDNLFQSLTAVEQVPDNKRNVVAGAGIFRRAANNRHDGIDRILQSL